ncbi:hypothetical protein MSI_04220 [Treponema sp. JC4]|uniref:hypothetical protein n=1 Tax=Treponema sp. JC4 TaxID=1124982 RepID=UPI00025AFB59|nr:hypothetical protein [Treponema sp. JC4]EID85991.1 hypothetical protein MSI_04220 [Treponema sp. JC4]
MKKIVGIIAAAALATSAFAEVNIGTWNKGVFAPVAYDGDEVRALENVPWGKINETGFGVRTGLGFSASTENAGFVLDAHVNPGAGGESLGLGDNGHVWVKPVDMLTIKLGKIDNNWGRTDLIYGTHDHSYRFGDGCLPNGEGIGAWREHNGTGYEVILQPVENFVIDYQGGFGSGNEEAYKTMWHNADFMVGYTIPDVAFIRAIVAPQAPGRNEKNESKEWMKIGVAADITAIENLFITVGATIPTLLDGYKTKTVSTYANGGFDTTTGTLKVTETKTYTKGDPAGVIQIGAGARYNLDALTLNAFVITKVNPKKQNDEGKVELGSIGLAFGVGLDYAFSDTWSVITDFRFQTDKYSFASFDTNGDATFAKTAFGAYVGACQQLTNASLDFGVEFGKNAGLSQYEEDKFNFAVPVTLTFSL